MQPEYELVKVLHCIPTFGGGGAERQIAYLGHAMQLMGIETHIAVLAGGPNLERLQQSGARLHWIEAAGNHDPRILMRLIHLARAIRPHIIQTWIPQMDIVGGLAAMCLGIPHVLTERTAAAAYGRGWKVFLRRLIGRFSAAVVANSDVGREYWSPIRKSRQTVVIRNGLPLAEISRAAPSRTGIEDVSRGSPIILAAGRMSEEKNVRRLLDALEDVLSRRPDAVAVLCGDGPLRREIEVSILMHPYGSRIRLLGFCDNLWGLLKTAAVFVSASFFEGSPNTVLEAMAAGCPLVVSDIPAHREILDSASAKLIAADSPAEIAAAITGTLSDPAGGIRRAGHARGRAEQMSVDRCAAEYVTLYRSLIKPSNLSKCDRLHETGNTDAP
jgi:glycosyltransferase involved in cell wall biosynthesis